MKQVIILDDAKERQDLILGEENVKELISLENVNVLEDFTETLQNLKKSRFECLKNIDLLIIHKSAIEDNLSELFNYAETASLELVLFSGNISNVDYAERDFKLLQISSTHLYSNLLIKFLRKYISEESPHLTEIVYGINWKLNYLLRLRQLLNLEAQGEDLEDHEDPEREFITKQDIKDSCLKVIGEEMISIQMVNDRINQIILNL